MNTSCLKTNYGRQKDTKMSKKNIFAFLVLFRLTLTLYSVDSDVSEWIDREFTESNIWKLKRKVETW